MTFCVIRNLFLVVKGDEEGEWDDGDNTDREHGDIHLYDDDNDDGDEHDDEAGGEEDDGDDVEN